MIDKLFRIFMVLCILFVLWLVFLYVPVLLHAQSKCLAGGYPAAEVDYKLNSYCMNLEGAVTVKVKELE